jgi:hypothetical protein
MAGDDDASLRLVAAVVEAASVREQMESLESTMQEGLPDTDSV